MTHSNTVNTLVHVNLYDDIDYYSDYYDSDYNEKDRKAFLDSDNMDMIEAIAEFLANAKSLTYFYFINKALKDMTYKFSENMDEIILKKYNPNTSRTEIILTKRRKTF